MWGTIASIVAPMAAKALFGGDEGGAGAGGGGQTGAALIRAIQAGQQQSLLQERPLEEIEPATSAKERGEYLVRMIQAIQNNETEGASAMDSVAASLMRDMQAGTGRIPEQPIVPPQEPSVQKVEAVKLAELEQQEEEKEKEEEPFVRGPSLYG
jgi:hypothetical protein